MGSETSGQVSAGLTLYTHIRVLRTPA